MPEILYRALPIVASLLLITYLFMLLRSRRIRQSYVYLRGRLGGGHARAVTVATSRVLCGRMVRFPDPGEHASGLLLTASAPRSNSSVHGGVQPGGRSTSTRRGDRSAQHPDAKFGEQGTKRGSRHSVHAGANLIPPGGAWRSCPHPTQDPKACRVRALSDLPSLPAIALGSRETACNREVRRSLAAIRAFLQPLSPEICAASAR